MAGESGFAAQKDTLLCCPQSPDQLWRLPLRSEGKGPGNETDQSLSSIIHCEALSVGLHGLRLIKLENNFRSNFSNLLKIRRDEFYCQPSIAYIVGYVKHNTHMAHILLSELN